ncbi:Phytoalexin-deficient 4-2 protein [Dorcoceras hygrometricum]|uniref:Phytoalexin-deficient 4-2 protein n=1 Tax=Dorcoceras hygrometricum TaxID=472368 RepID=A0A2Z7BCV7_9LAMI|nr:Phytoalexin-deficient 4-2 protein [Dorcoceras hygrometricum]
MLRNEISELKAEVAKSTVELSSWNKANITLQNIYENQNQAKLSHSFEEAKAENISLKSSSAESSSDEQEDADILKTELSKLQAENEMLRNEISELKAEVAKSTVELSSWNKANITLQNIYENQNQASDKTGIGFNDSEFCEGESSTQSRPAYDKFNKMSFVKADMIYNCLESAGSFNAITIEKFSLLTAVVCGVKMNWAKFLFGVLKKMVTAGSKQDKGFAIQISLLLATFPTVELGESSEFPASKILSKKTVLRFISINNRDAEEITGEVEQKAVSKKRSADDVSAAVPKKRRSIKKKSVSSFSTLEMVAVAEEAIPIQQVAESLDVEEPRCSSADAVDLIIQQVLDETRAADAPADTTEPAVTEEKNWFDLPYDDLVKQWEAERPVVTASDTEDEDLATVDVAPADEVQQVQDFEAPISAEDVLSADEKMSLDDILLSIPVDIPLPSTCMEVTKIKMGQMIKIPGVTEKTWFLNSLPRIPADDKGKEILVEKDPVQGNPAAEHYSLICADIDLLVDLRAKVIAEVATFFHSFSLRKLASINIEEMYKKEEQVLSWGETESPQEAIQRKFYILLKYRTILVWKFLEAWRVNFAPGQGSSAVDIQGSPRDRGAVIARNNTNTRSLCWIRTMIMVDGVWTVEPCADKWVKIPRKVVSTKVPLQRQYDDTLPTMSVFFKLLRKRWADVCLEAVEFCAQRLLPVGSIRSCRSLQWSESVSSFAPNQPTVFAVRISQFCSVFVNMSLFSWLPSTDISEFLSSIALDRTILHNVQRSQDSFAVAPSVQLSLEQHLSSDSSSSLHFDQTDINATASSRPTISPDLSAVFADFQAALSEQIFASQSDISSRMHKLEQSVCDSLRDQADIFKSLSQGARQEVRTPDDVHTLRFNEFRKNVLTQNATIFQGLADVRQVVDAVNAKVDIMAKRVNDIQKDAEATKEALSHQLLEFQSSAQENHNVIHAQLSELVDYIHRGSADKKGESGSRGLQKPASIQKEGSAVTPSFEQRVQMAQRRIVQTVLDADANRESQDAAERDRERRRKEARSLKRRRKD